MSDVKEINSFNDAVEIVSDKMSSWLHDLAALFPNIVLALIVMVLASILAMLASRIGCKAITKMGHNEMLAGLTSAILKLLVLLFGLYLALSILQLDRTVTSLLAGAGILGLALGFAFQDAAANLLAGIVLGIRRPFKVGDLIRTNDHLGYVQKLNLRNTLIENFSGQLILIPNKLVFENPMENYSYTGKRRISFAVGVGYSTDLELAKSTLEKAAKDIPDLSKKEESKAYCMEFGDSSINFRLDVWIDFPEGPSYLDTISAGTIAIKKHFDEHDINIPFPIRTLDVNQAISIESKE